MKNTNGKLEALISQAPRDARICHALSDTALKEGDLQEALNQALKAVDLGLQAGSPNLWHLRHCARTLVEANMHGLALKVLETSGLHDPDHIMTLQKARALRALKRAPEAFELLKVAMKEAPDATNLEQIESYAEGMQAG